MGLECSPVVQLSRSDYHPEISALCKSLREKPVDPLPASPMFCRWTTELRRKFPGFEHELAEDGGRDGRKRFKGEPEWQARHVRERHADGQPAENRIPSIVEVQKLGVCCRGWVGQLHRRSRGDSIRTVPAVCDGEVFETTRARSHYTLAVIPNNVLEFYGSKVDPTWKFFGEFRGPLNHANASQTEVSTQRRGFIDDGRSQTGPNPFAIFRALDAQV